MHTRPLPDLDATEALGRAIALQLRPGDSVLLSGKLGAGKTALCRALLRAICADPQLDVPSPTYTLVQSYNAPHFAVHHFDLWRLTPPTSPGTLAELGWDDAADGVALVEWPDRLGDAAPADALHIALHLPDRHATLSGWPDRIDAL